ncbi:MAG: hypothetical protein V4584_06040 [Verrucomicrobiota bacterium]
MKALRHPIIGALLLLAGQPSRADEEKPRVIESPGQALSIRQEDTGGFKETLLFADKDLKPVELEKGGFPWPAVYHFAPDEKTVLRTQKTGSGENVVMLYLIGQNGRVEEVPGFNDGLWKLADSVSPIKKKDLYHTGVSRASWAVDSSTLELVVRGSDARESGTGIEFPITYDLKTKTFRLTPSPAVPAKSSSKQ